MKQKQWRCCRCRFQNEDSRLRHRLIIARLERTERKPTENRGKASAVITSLFPNYILVVFRKLHCCTILSTTTTIQLRMVWTFIEQVQWVMPGSGRHSVCPRQPSGLFFAAFNAICHAAVFYFWYRFWWHSLRILRKREFFSWSPRNSSRESNPAKIH